MEGRGPLPKASHPFPENINLRKIIGTPAVWTAMKGFVLFTGVPIILVSIKMLISPEEKSALQKLSESEFIAYIDKYKAAFETQSRHIPGQFPIEKMNPLGYFPDKNLNLDDRVHFYAPERD